jgi:uncharacterized membrane protein YjgN (DUF898 family)
MQKITMTAIIWFSIFPPLCPKHVVAYHEIGTFFGKSSFAMSASATEAAKIVTAAMISTRKLRPT